MSSFWVHLDEEEVSRIREAVLASEKQVKVAFHRALRRTMRAIRTKASKDLRLKLKIPSKVWKTRLRFYVRNREGNQRLWFGLDPISLSRLNPRQTKAGISASGGIRRKGAFMPRKGKLDGIVFKRRPGAPRLPIDKQSFEVEEQVLLYIEDELFSEIEPLLYKNFEKELNWETDDRNPKNK